MNPLKNRISLIVRGILLSSLAVAPAVAQNVNGACLYALDPSAQQAFFISGNAKITTDCSIVVESASSAAFAMGGADTLYLGNHAQVGVVGGWQLNGQSMIDTISNQQVQPINITSPGDPLASVAAPTQGTIVSSAPVTYSSSNPPPNNTLSPGVYCGGISFTNPGGAKYMMSPGTYIMAGGGFTLASSANVQGNGVTIYNTSSAGWGCGASYSYTPISINGQANVILTAPSTGPLAGIVLFGDRNGCATPGACTDNINGKASATFNGILYFKSDLLLLNGTSSSGGCMDVVADKITINGDTYSGGNSCFLNPISISISPTSVGLYGGQTQQFTATVTNTYFANVTWSISPGVGSIDQSGNYTAPPTIPTEQTVTVTATSQADSTKSASATITLFPPITINISPTNATLYGGQQQQFSATVTNAFNAAVVWSISPSGTGSISNSGVYTAPPAITSQQTVTVNATSEANPALSASATVTLEPPITVSVSPESATLYGNQTQQFTATVGNTTNTSVTWSISPSGTGSVGASGLYMALASITSQQTVVVTATSQADPTKSASATVTLLPPVTISVNPPSITLSGGQSQPFTATVSNTSNATVTWSISPAGIGTFTSDGVYTAPSSIPTSQTLTVTATSQADPTKTATATIYLVGNCGSNGYGYVRSIVIDHTKIPNTDQANFPFLFNTTDPAFKSAANGGHVSNANGYDIIFSTDPTAGTKLDHELEDYDPATGQVIAWVRIPTLSHTTDTTLYVFYGNPGITTPQANPAGVWDANYKGVWHVANGTVLSLADSTVNANNAADAGATAAAGQIDGGMQTNGSTYATIGTPASLANLAKGNATFSAWVDTATGAGGRLMGKDDNNGSAGWALGINSQNQVDFVVVYSGGDLRLDSSKAVGNGAWSYVTVTLAGSTSQPGQATIYVNGVQAGTGSGGSGSTTDDSAQTAYLANATYGNQESHPLNGISDEFRISSVVRSADWIATEYNNQGSPSTFYSLGTEGTIVVSPAAATLYANQTQQFTTCSAVNWSIPAGAPGAISPDGFYTAPSSITAQESVVVTATSTTDSTKTGTATITLLPTPQNPTLVLAASSQPPYVTGTTQQFIATLTNQAGTPLSEAEVTFTVTGANPTSGNGTTSISGTAAFSYAGANSGTDTIQAVATVGGVQVTSNSVQANWVAPLEQVSTTTLLGEFFLSDGCGCFDTPPTATPVFTQAFPTINFNPPAGTVPGNTSDINVNSRPFTDVTTDLHGNFTGTIVAQGNGLQAGVGSMFTFQVALFGSFTVASAGNVVFNFYDDDGFEFGIGGGAQRVSGSSLDMPSSTAFALYPSMGAYDVATAPVGNQVVVYFPAPGSYPYEVDYSECCGGQLVLTMTQGASSPTGVAPTGSLTISPGTLQPLPVGGQQAFTILASDAAGNPVANTNVSLVVTGVDSLQLSGTTDSTGHVTIAYKDVNPGTALVQAVGFIGGMVTYSNQVTVPWTQSASTTTGSGTGTGTGASLSVSISAQNTVILPAALQLSGSAADTALPQGDTISLAWSQVSGPGSVVFANPQQASSTATFSEPGSYQLELTATDVNGSASAQITVAVNPQPGTDGGWIGGPAYGSKVSGIVPITVASGTTLASGVLTVYPANNPSAVTVLNSNTKGSGQIGTWDTTQVSNGSYWITLQATTTGGSSEYNLALVTVVGNNKPGRIATTITDLVVPANGLPINIQRTYDSLNEGISGDFGFGWNLSTTVDLAVDPSGDVTFTLGGIRRTFDLTPQYLSWLFPWYVPEFTPEPGFHGTLSANGAGCPDLFDFLVPDGSLWACIGGGYYTPAAYVYTDPTGTSYLISAGGNLQEIIDKNGNSINVAANGITSSTGLSVPFVRDSSGRITSITDPMGNVYQYAYDVNGNLASVTYPNISTSTTYTYDSNHRYLSGSDFNGNPAPSSSYYGPTDTDPNGLPLGGRIKSVTDALGETTTYAYNLQVAACPVTPNNNLVTTATTVTYPQDAGGNTGTASMRYNCAGDVVSSTDPLGHITTNAYDANRNLISVTDPMGQITSYTYDSNGNRTATAYPKTATSTNTTSYVTFNQYSQLTSATDELGHVRTFNYDVNFNPQTVTDGLGTLASFAFNSDGTMQSGAIGYDIGVQPALGSHFTYDQNGNLASRTDALGRTTSYLYDNLGHKTQMTQPAQSQGQSGAVTNYKYDPFGNLTETDLPLGRTTRSTYDGNNNKITDTDGNNKTTGYKYDALNRLIETDYPDGTKATQTYDFRGNVIDAKDQAGNVTHHVYDLAGREVSETRAYGTPNAVTTQNSYDNDGRKLSETVGYGTASATTTGYSYDAAGNVTGVSGTQGTFHFAFDDARNLISNTDGNGYKTSYLYDDRKRPTETDYPDGSKKQYGYDGPGNLTLVTDEAGNQVQYNYDGVNQLNTVVDLNSPNTGANTTTYGYDGDGNLVTSQDANSHATASNFDVFGELTQRTLPDQSSQESRQYDNNGNLTSLTHFNTVATTYSYDSLNRLLSRATPGEATVSFTYTATGKYATSTDASGSTTYSYDSMDRLTAKATPEGTLAYTYDAAGRVASIASLNPGGASMSYTYDSLGRLSTVADARFGTTNYTYDNANNVATVTYPNGIQAQFQYDQLNRVKALVTQNTGYSYMRDPTGKLTNLLESSNRSAIWNYDGINRLTNEQIANAPSGNNGNVAYGLDPVGNRLSETSSISGLNPGTFGYNADDELSSETYDQNGNVVAAGGKTYSFDSENHLVSANGGALAMVYDAFGNRVAKTVNGVTTRYLVEDDENPTGQAQVFDELNGAGAVTRTYAYGLQRISEGQVLNGSWTPSFYVYDGGGNVRELANAAGAITDTYEYDAFGNEFTVSGTTPNNYMYRGEQYDSDLGLYYLRARYYNPETGRFLSRDPEDGFIDDPSTLHKYLYAGGDPLNRIDPTGREDLVEYKLLRKQIAGLGLQAHHLIEKRFLYLFDFTACELAVALTPADHQVITNLWRAAIPYGPNGTGCATIAQVLSTAQAIYADEVYAAILVSLGLD